MEVLTGLGLFGAGFIAGGLLMADYFKSLKRVQDYERGRAADREAAARSRATQLEYQLEMKASALVRMEQRQACEASWCDGYEAGMREGMRGQTIGDVINMTRLHNARRVRSVNE